MNDDNAPLTKKEFNEGLQKFAEDILKPTFDNLFEEIGGVKGRVGNLEICVDSLSTRLTSVEAGLTNVETRLISVETRLTRVESQMVTKEYLDDKLADMEGRVNSRFNTLVTILTEKEILRVRDVNRIRHSAI